MQTRLDEPGYHPRCVKRGTGRYAEIYKVKNGKREDPDEDDPVEQALAAAERARRAKWRQLAAAKKP